MSIQSEWYHYFLIISVSSYILSCNLLIYKVMGLVPILVIWSRKKKNFYWKAKWKMKRLQDGDLPIIIDHGTQKIMSLTVAANIHLPTTWCTSTWKQGESKDNEARDIVSDTPLSHSSLWLANGLSSSLDSKDEDLSDSEHGEELVFLDAGFSW